MTVRVLHRLAVLGISLVFLIPLLWMLLVSIAEPGTGLLASSSEILSDPHIENYGEALSERRMGSFGTQLLNTSLLSVLCVIGQCLTCSLAGYALARISFRGAKVVLMLVLATMMLPLQLVTIPHFVMFREAGLIDTFSPLVLPCFLGGAPFFIFLYRQAFLSLPHELTEAAEMDGAGFFRTWWSVMMPLVRPMTWTVALFTFLATWNDFWAPLIYLTSEENRTLALGLAAFNRTYNLPVELMMAASAVILTPCLIAYFLCQRLFIKGLATAASKH